MGRKECIYRFSLKYLEYGILYFFVVLPLIVKPVKKEYNAFIENNDSSWTSCLDLLKKRCSAQIANEPQIVKSVQYAQKVIFQTSNVSDWMYYDKGVVQGGYTIKVLLKTMSKAEAESFKKELGW